MIQRKKVDINEKFYDGFEGEPEMIFCLMEKHAVIEKIGIGTVYKRAFREKQGVRLKRTEKRSSYLVQRRIACMIKSMR